MFQFKGMSNDEIRLHYYTHFRRNTTFAPKGSEKEAEWIKRHEKHMEACKAKVKRQRAEREGTIVSPQDDSIAKTRKKSCANKRRKVVHESFSGSDKEEDEEEVSTAELEKLM